MNTAEKGIYIKEKDIEIMKKSKMIEETISLLEEAVHNLEKSQNYTKARKKYWRSKKGTAQKKKFSDERKHKPMKTKIKDSQLDGNDYIRLYHQRYRQARKDDQGRSYWNLYSRFRTLKRNGIVDENCSFKTYCEVEGIVFHTEPIQWE